MEGREKATINPEQHKRPFVHPISEQSQRSMLTWEAAAAVHRYKCLFALKGLLQSFLLTSGLCLWVKR